MLVFTVLLFKHQREVIINDVPMCWIIYDMNQLLWLYLGDNVLVLWRAWSPSDLWWGTCSLVYLYCHISKKSSIFVLSHLISGTSSSKFSAAGPSFTDDIAYLIWLYCVLTCVALLAAWLGLHSYTVVSNYTDSISPFSFPSYTNTYSWMITTQDADSNMFKRIGVFLTCLNLPLASMKK